MTIEKETLQGFGATLMDSGVAFRVWAPNAEAVSVIGDFNEWNPATNPMERAADGTWSAQVPEAAIGDEYRFLIRNGGHEFSRIDPYAREVTNSVGNGVISDPNFDWEGDAFQIAPKNELVIYEMHIGTFAGEPGKPGNFDAAIQKLDQLVHLGVNSVEIMPIAEFAGDLSWGYNPAHIFAVESCYGGPQELKRFVKEAHRRGIAVILDLVINHFGPSDLDMWRFDGWFENDGGGIYFYNDWRAKTPWGATRPDYGREEIRQMLRDNAVMWLDEFRIDGLRMDGTLFIRNANGQPNDPPSDLPEGWSLMRWITDEVRKRGKLSIAEDLQDNEWLTKPGSDGGAGFDAQWCSRFVHPVRENAETAEDQHRSMLTLASSVAHHFNGDPFERVIYSESHDEVANGRSRVPQSIDPGNPASVFAQKRASLAAALAFTSPGIPMIFQGQEFLTPGYFQDTEPLDWGRLDEHRGLVHLHRDLIHLRLNRSGVSRGLTGSNVSFLALDEASNVMAFHRWHSGGPGDDVVVIVNFSNNDLRDVRVPFPYAGSWKLRINTTWSGYSPAFAGEAHDAEAGAIGDATGVMAHLMIPGYTLLVYSQDPENAA
jgi:1,4-alpha-glucan branching enzyme